MTKAMKWFLIICSIVIGTGLALSILGFALGGTKGFDRIEERTKWIDLGASGSYKSLSNTYDSFTSMDIECDFGKVELIEGNEYKVEITYPKRNEPTARVEKDTLVVKCKMDRKRWLNLGFLRGWNQSKASLKIYYPKDTEFDSVKVQNDLGDLKINSLRAKTLNVGLDLGSITLDQVEADLLIANLDAGDMKAKNLTTKGMDAELNLGSMNIQGAIYGRTNATLDLGDCTITTSVPKNQYTIMTSIDLGSCQIDGNSSSSLENSNAENRMELNCDMGSIEVNFE